MTLDMHFAEFHNIYAFYGFGIETQIAQPAAKVRVTIDLSMPMERPGWTAYDHMTYMF